MENTVTLQLNIQGDQHRLLAGSLQGSFKLIEDAFGVLISSRGDKILVKGDNKSVPRAEKLIQEMLDISEMGFSLKPEDIRYAIHAIRDGQEASLKDLFINHIPVSSKKRFIIPKNLTQKKYIEAIKKYDIVVGIGPAGTGKTYIAMAMAIDAFLKKQISRIILARPAVEAGEKLGFLPGDMYEKVNPYLRPLHDALFDMMDLEKAAKLIERGIIEIAPLAFMRGRTLNDAFIILDEAQNTTSEQMKMYLTRLGFNSKTVITGDITQIDLPAGKLSGLIEAERILKNVEGIQFIYFSKSDVVRHKLVQEIVNAYEEYDKRNQQ
jgi:phosphate starvation-inducible PhoH-like protein